ncbi:hypothetical protein CI610_00073 [invertebrate metagenome]|uniref:STAS domain-containing protein n=1 Tax=invertebrate metagenome TaxID=1711999 RepID=A0A2H9TCD9_9ZZZZ
MECSTRFYKGCQIIELHKSLVAKSSKEIQQIFNLILENQSSDIIIDLSNVENIDYAGIGAITFLYKRLKERKREMGLLGVNQNIEEWLNTLHINNTIKSYTNINDFISDTHHALGYYH